VHNRFRRRAARFGLWLFRRYSTSPAVGRARPRRLRPALLFEQALDSDLYHAHLIPLVRLYFAFFNRAPDAAGLRYWLTICLAGVGLETVEAAFASSGEFWDRVGVLDDEAFVCRLFNDMYGVAPAEDALLFYVGELQKGVCERSLMVSRFAASPDFHARIAPEVYVTMMYLMLLGRVPDRPGFDYWLKRRRGGLHPANEIMASAEYQTRHAGAA